MESTTSNSSLKIGQRVNISKKNGSSALGYIRFVGETHFGEGLWVGVELDEPGKLLFNKK